MIPSPEYQPYTDAFYMGCMWPVAMKLGDGSTDWCGEPVCVRVIFETGGRTMLCATHEKALKKRREDRIKERQERGSHGNG